MKRVFLVVLVGLLSAMVFAGSYPKGCEPRDYRFENSELILNELGEQRLFLIYNRSQQLVEIQRKQSPDSFMSPNLSARLGPGFWSAFASDIPALSFECHVTDHENTRKLDCGEVLEVCEYPRAKFALSNMGNYWVSANKPQRDVINDSAAKGIYLRW